MNENRDSIMRMARGAFEERVDYEMDKVIQNILDPNTKATAKHKITLTIELTPDDDPGVLVPHEVGDGGLLLMPTRANIPDPQRDDWKPTTCPICGAECWETEIHRQALAAEPGLRAVCTDCGLRGAAGVGLVDTSNKKEEKDHE